MLVPAAAPTALTLVAIAAAGWWAWLLRGTTFYYDEWNFVMAQGQSLGQALIAPHVGHLVAVPVLVYRLLFALVGLAHYQAYVAVGIAFNLLLVALLFVYMRRRVHPALAFLGSVAVLAGGQAWQDILWPFNITFTATLAAGIGALLLLDRGDAAGRVGASALLCLSVASSGIGLAVLAGVAVELFLRRSTWRALWVVAAPAVLYLAWYLSERAAIARWTNPAWSRSGRIPAYAWHSLSAGVGALAGQRTNGPSEVIAAAVAILVLARLVTGRRNAGRAAMTVVAGLAFWALVELARGSVDPPRASRLLEPDAVFILVALAEVGTWERLRRLRPARLAAGFAIALLGLGVAAAGWSNAATFKTGARFLRGQAVALRAELAGVQLAGARLAGGFQPDPRLAPQITAGPYLAAVRALGSPADSMSELLAAPEALRSRVDAMLVAGLRPSLAPIGRTACPPSGAASGTTAVLGPAPLLVGAPASAPVQVRLRHLASAWPAAPTLVVPAGRTVLVEPGAGRPPLTWAAQLTTRAPGGFGLCPA